MDSLGIGETVSGEEDQASTVNSIVSSFVYALFLRISMTSSPVLSIDIGDLGYVERIS